MTGAGGPLPRRLPGWCRRPQGLPRRASPRAAPAASPRVSGPRENEPGGGRVPFMPPHPPDPTRLPLQGVQLGRIWSGKGPQRTGRSRRPPSQRHHLSASSPVEWGHSHLRAARCPRQEGPRGAVGSGPACATHSPRAASALPPPSAPGKARGPRPPRSLRTCRGQMGPPSMRGL